MEGVGIAPLSKRSLAKMNKGLPVRILKGNSNLLLHPNKIGGIMKAFSKNKGRQIALSPEEITANGEGIFGNAFDNVLKKVGIKKAVYKAGDKLKPVVKQAIDKGATALEKAVPQLRPAIHPLADLTKDYLDRPGYYQKNKGRNALRSLKRIGVRAGTQIAREQAMKYAMGEGLYAGNGLYAGGDGYVRGVPNPMSSGYGVRTNVAHRMLIPALQSQPMGENFMWGSTLQPQYAHLHR